MSAKFLDGRARVCGIPTNGLSRSLKHSGKPMRSLGRAVDVRIKTRCANHCVISHGLSLSLKKLPARTHAQGRYFREVAIIGGMDCSHPVSAAMSAFGMAIAVAKCPLMTPKQICRKTQSMSLLGVKRTCPFALHMSAYDPKRTLRA
jgi:hypothetical protein